MDPEAFVYMALSSEGEVGKGAVVVDSANCHAKYTALSDIEPAAVRERLGEQIERQPENLWVVHKTDAHLHVFAYPRSRAVAKMRAGSLSKVIEDHSVPH